MIERSAEPSRQPLPARPQEPQRPNEPSRLLQPTRVTARTLNSVELAFLERLSLNAWTSPPVFDHRLLERVVDAGYVAQQPAALDAVHYEITDNGRAAVIAVTS